MVYAMKAPVPQSPADLHKPQSWKPPSPSPFVIDVGANIGWFTLNAAAAGGTVAAFEGAGLRLRAFLGGSVFGGHSWGNRSYELASTRGGFQHGLSMH